MLGQFGEIETSKRIIAEFIRMNKYGYKEGYFLFNFYSKTK
jgi:hypothetical protein